MHREQASLMRSDRNENSPAMSTSSCRRDRETLIEQGEASKGEHQESEAFWKMAESPACGRQRQQAEHTDEFQRNAVREQHVDEHGKGRQHHVELVRRLPPYQSIVNRLGGSPAQVVSQECWPHTWLQITTGRRVVIEIRSHRAQRIEVNNIHHDRRRHRKREP